MYVIWEALIVQTTLCWLVCGNLVGEWSDNRNCCNSRLPAAAVVVLTSSYTQLVLFIFVHYVLSRGYPSSIKKYQKLLTSLSCCYRIGYRFVSGWGNLLDDFQRQRWPNSEIATPGKVASVRLSHTCYSCYGFEDNFGIKLVFTYRQSC